MNYGIKTEGLFIGNQNNYNNVNARILREEEVNRRALIEKNSNIKNLLILKRRSKTQPFCYAFDKEIDAYL